MKTKSNKNIIYSTLFILALVVYSLLLVNQGIHPTDVGYNYGNFEHFDTLDGMWKFSTYLATAIGAAFTHLPGGHTLLGLNIYTGLVKASIAVITYLLCVKVFHIHRGVAFLAELAALGYCWCPTALLYNYVTYLLFTLGAVLLCIAVEKEKNYWYILAGVCLGVNVMVRIPNLAEMALIAALWFYCIIRKIKFAEAMKRTGYCILGYVIGIAVILLWIVCRYGATAYIQGIQEILSMPGEAGSYSLKYMLLGDYYEYRTNLIWLILALVYTVIGIILFRVSAGKMLWYKRIFYCICNLSLIALYYRLGMFRFVYYDYVGIIRVGILFLMLAGALGLYVMFFGGEDYALRMHGATMGIIILITPLGSNNLLFTAENNLFWVMPFVFHFCYKWLTKKVPYYLETLRITYVTLVLFVAVQGVLFGSTFVFRDGINGEKRTEKITEIQALKGMYTRPEMKKSLMEINDYLVNNNLQDTDAILYQDLPGLSFFLGLEPAMTTTWPDLASFSTDKFRMELERIGARNTTEEKPLLILGCDLQTDDVKINMLREYVEKYGYDQVFTNDLCSIYR